MTDQELLEQYKRLRHGKKLFKEERRRERRKSFKYWLKFKTPPYAVLFMIVICFACAGFGISRAIQAGRLQHQKNLVLGQREAFTIDQLFNSITVNYVYNLTDTNETISTNAYTSIEQSPTKYLYRIIFEIENNHLIDNATYTFGYNPYIYDGYLEYFLEDLAVSEIVIMGQHYDDSTFVRDHVYDSTIEKFGFYFKVTTVNDDLFYPHPHPKPTSYTMTAIHGGFSTLQVLIYYHNLDLL